MKKKLIFYTCISVCKLWKQATLRNWEKIIEIEHLQFSHGHDHKQAIAISNSEAAEIVLCAAPFVKTLITEESSDRKRQYISIGPHYYRVQDFQIEKLLKVLIRKSTGITKLECGAPPKITLLKQLFKKNKITKLRLLHDHHFMISKIPTRGIEELNVKYNLKVDHVVSFEGVNSVFFV